MKMLVILVIIMIISPCSTLSISEILSKIKIKQEFNLGLSKNKNGTVSMTKKNINLEEYPVKINQVSQSSVSINGTELIPLSYYGNFCCIPANLSDIVQYLKELWPKDERYKGFCHVSEEASLYQQVENRIRLLWQSGKVKDLIEIVGCLQDINSQSCELINSVLCKEEQKSKLPFFNGCKEFKYHKKYQCKDGKIDIWDTPRLHKLSDFNPNIF